MDAATAYARLPLEVFRIVLSFLPRPRRIRPRPAAGLQRSLEALQRSPKVTPMAFYGVEDFLLET